MLVADGLWLGCCFATVVTSRSVGSPPPRVATKAMPAIATAMTLRITTGEGKTAPRCVRIRAISDLEAEATGGALPLAGGPQPAQPAHEQRGGGERLGPVDEGVEDLVVARRGHVELLAHRGLLGAGVLPPLALELEDLAVTLAQVRRGVGVALECVGGVHGAPPPGIVGSPDTAGEPHYRATNHTDVIRSRGESPTESEPIGSGP